MGQPFELGQLGNYINVNDNDLTVGIGTSVSVTGTLSATSLVGDGSGLTGTGIVVSTRNGFAGINSTGDEVTNVTSLRFDSNSGLAVTSLGPGEAFVNFGSSFNPYTVQGQDSLDATGEEELEIIAGPGIEITTDANSTPKSITFTNNATTIEYADNVIGGIGSVTELYSSGISTLAANGGITTTGGSLFTKQLSVAGVVTATSFYGDGASLSNTGATLSAGSGTQRVALTSLTSGVMTSAATDSNLTYDSSTGTLSATSFSGDGANLSNTGATLSAGSGTQRVALTSLTSGVMTSAATDSALTYNTSTGTLSATAFSGDGASLSNTGATLSAASGEQKVVLTSLSSGVMTTAATDSALTYNQNNNTLDASISGIASVTSEWVLGADVGNTYYTFTGPGFDGTEQNSTIYLTRGQRYKFTNNLGAHPFRIQSTVNGSVGTQYNDGLSTNDVDNGTIEWDVQMDAPSTLYYQCTAHTAMGGVIYIANPTDTPTITQLAYSTTPNVVETTSTSAVRVNGSITVETTSSAWHRRINFKTNYASSYGQSRTNQQTFTLYAKGPTNLVCGTSNAGSALSQDTYWNGTYNTIFGGRGPAGADEPGYNLSLTSANNTFIGAAAGKSVSYSKNTAVGARAGNSDTSTTGNCMALGYNAQWNTGGSNQIVLGDNNIATLNCNVQTISSLSDVRDKTNIENIPVGLNYINALRPVKFDWERRDGSYQGQKAFGFIAQELNDVQDQFGYKEYTKLVYEHDPNRLEASPMNTYPILVKAVQELSQQNQELLRRIEELENRLNGG